MFRHEAMSDSLWLCGLQQAKLPFYYLPEFAQIHIQWWASLVAQMVKNLLVMQQTWVQSLAEEDPLEKEMATRSRILAWKIPWREEPSGATIHGVTESDMTEESEHTHDYMSIESVRSSSHIFLCGPLLLLHWIFSSIRIFSNESALYIRWPKYWSFGFSISPSHEYSGFISFRVDWLNLLAVQGTLSITIAGKHRFFGSQPLWSNSDIHTWLLEKS